MGFRRLWRTNSIHLYNVNRLRNKHTSFPLIWSVRGETENLFLPAPVLLVLFYKISMLWVDSTSSRRERFPSDEMFGSL